jgi:hypothetical protein
MQMTATVRVTLDETRILVSDEAGEPGSRLAD